MKDPLKKLIGQLNEINDPIDLETSILKSIEQTESAKRRIERYRTQGLKALKISLVLLAVLAVLLSRPASLQSVADTMVTYTSIAIALTLLFVQLELGKKKIFNNQKNNIS